MRNHEKEQKPVKKKKQRVINMNYPPADFPMERLEEFGVSPDDVEPLRKRWKVKEFKSDAKPSPV